MYISWKPLGTFFIALYLQVFVPSDPAHHMVGVDFGEPTRNCLGRGQICRIEELEWGSHWGPEALGEAWLDSAGVFHLSFLSAFWDVADESHSDSLGLSNPMSMPFLPIDKQRFEPFQGIGKREKNRIYFEIPLQKGK